MDRLIFINAEEEEKKKNRSPVSKERRGKKGSRKLKGFQAERTAMAYSITPHLQLTEGEREG